MCDEPGGTPFCPIRLTQSSHISYQRKTPGSLQAPTSKIAAGKDEVSITLDVKLAPGEYTCSVLGQAQVPYSKDAKMTPKLNVLVSIPARPITIVVTPKK